MNRGRVTVGNIVFVGDGASVLVADAVNEGVTVRVDGGVGVAVVIGVCDGRAVSVEVGDRVVATTGVIPGGVQDASRNNTNSAPKKSFRIVLQCCCGYREAERGRPYKARNSSLAASSLARRSWLSCLPARLI